LYKNHVQLFLRNEGYRYDGSVIGFSQSDNECFEPCDIRGLIQANQLYLLSTSAKIQLRDLVGILAPSPEPLFDLNAPFHWPNPDSGNSMTLELISSTDGTIRDNRIFMAFTRITPYSDFNFSRTGYSGKPQTLPIV